MRQPIITLLTDFGAKDHYVASMKGVILGINPRCTLVDITHEVPPQNIEDGAFVLANAYSHFPKGTIHVAIVDPGVGSPRKPILLVTRNYFFLGPDNGLLSFAASKDGVKEARELSRKKFFLPRLSTTFHGRDIFAPVSAHLSLGVRPSLLGPKLNGWAKLDMSEARIVGRNLVGRVLYIDSFGNILSNIDETKLLRFTRGRPFVVKIGRRRIGSLKKGYWEVEKGDPIALIGSEGLLELAVREGNAQKVLKVERGDSIRVQLNGGVER